MAFRKHELGIELLLINKVGTGFNKAAGQVHRFAAQVDTISAKSAFAASSLMSVNAGFMSAAALGLIANFAIQNVRYFAQIETKWLEVTTLMPREHKHATDLILQDVRQFTKDYGRELTETINAAYESISAGIEGDEVVEFLEKVNKSARAGVAQLDTAADALTTVMNIYNEDVDEADEISDAFFATIQIGKTRFSELATSVGNYLPLLQNLNVGYEEALLLQGALTAQGRTASEASTQLAGLATAFLKEGQTKDFLRSINIDVREFIVEGGNMIELLHIMKAALEDEGRVFSEVITRKEAANAALAIVNEKFVSDYVRGQENMADATEIAFTKVEGALQIKLDRMKSFWADYRLSAVEALKLAQGVSVVTENLIELEEHLGEVNVAQLLAEASSLGLSVAMGNVWGTGKGLKDMFGYLSTETDNQTLALDHNYGSMEGVLGLSESLLIIDGELVEKNSDLGLSFAGVTAAAEAFLQKQKALSISTKNLWSNLGNLNWALGETHRAMNSTGVISSRGPAGNEWAGGSQFQGGRWDVAKDTRNAWKWKDYTAGIPNSLLTENEERLKKSTGRSGGGKDKDFDIDSLKYEYGDITPQQFLAVLQRRLLEAGGKYTPEGSRIYGTIVSVQDKIIADKKAAEEKIIKEYQEISQREWDNIGTQYWVEDTRHSQGELSDTEYLGLLNKRIQRFGTYEGWGLEAHNKVQSMMKKFKSDSRQSEDLMYELGYTTPETYEQSLRDRVTAAGRGSLAGLQAERELQRFLEKRDSELKKLLENLNDKLEEGFKVVLDVDMDPAIIMRADTTRFAIRREANRRGVPLARLPNR